MTYPAFYLTLYLAIGYASAIIGIVRGKDGYWQGRGSKLLFLIAQEMIIWGPMLLLLLLVDIASKIQERQEASR